MTGPAQRQAALRALVLSRTTRQRLKRLVPDGGRYVDTAQPRPDGLFDVWVSDVVLAALEKQRKPGETDDDVVLRIMRERAERKP